jgi:hypothetical protein
MDLMNQPFGQLSTTLQNGLMGQNVQCPIHEDMEQLSNANLMRALRDNKT